MPIDAALLSVAGLAGVAVVAPILLSRRAGWATSFVYGATILLAAILFATGLYSLLGRSGASDGIVLPVGLPWIGAHFAIDPLSAAFLVIINLGAVITGFYALDYGRHEEEPARVLPFYPAFLAGMNLVLLTADAFSFLVAWEFMSLSSWALVMAHHHDEENRRAGYIYLVMASFGTLMLLLAFGLLAGPDGGYAFDAIRTAEHVPWIAGLVLILMLLGAGSKAGLVPLHVWLPLAHPAAPSHVSALMSGVMTKVAVYGFIRVVFDLAGEPAWWWSVVVLALGAASAVLGVLHAVLQRDLKRLLAYSTVENIGIVFIGLGLALAFKTNDMAGAAALAVTASIFHAFNHSLFKSLLFFGAGNVLMGSGERDIEKLGGLVHRMPETAYLFLGGCLAISALPPLNGFVSEWLILQAILISPELPQWALRFLVPASGAMLALAAALAGACFVRAFGITFLSRPRSPAAAEATEVGRWQIRAMYALLMICLIAGVFPGPFLDAIGPASQMLVDGAMPRQPVLPHLAIIPISESRSSYSGFLVFFFILMASWAAIRVIHNLASRAVRRGPAWDCGFPDASPVTQYTADSFAQPIRRVFGPIAFRAKISQVMPPPGDSSPAQLTLSLRDLVWEFVYEPIEGAVLYAAERLNILQFLTIRSYLSLVFAALVLLLVLVATWA
jgi:formate hydrogenlyase subunit 3/multisubunit Na+/H+ antiporter MnhD subunit